MRNIEKGQCIKKQGRMYTTASVTCCQEMGSGTTFASSSKKKSDTALEIVWICGEYMSEDYLGHFGLFC